LLPRGNVAFGAGPGLGIAQINARGKRPRRAGKNHSPGIEVVVKLAGDSGELANKLLVEGVQATASIEADYSDPSLSLDGYDSIAHEVLPDSASLASMAANFERPRSNIRTQWTNPEDPCSTRVASRSSAALLLAGTRGQPPTDP